MMNGNARREPSPSWDHEYYVELCALATSGTLTDEEWSDLRGHLTGCSDCRKQVQEYREIARTGMAVLMPDQASDDQAKAQESWSSEAAKQELFARIARGEAVVQYRSRVDLQPKRPGWLRLLFGRPPQVALRFAAIVLVVTLTAAAYRFGTKRADERAAVQAQSWSSEEGSLRSQLQQAMRDRAALAANLNARSAEFRSVSEQLRAQAAEVEKWKALQSQTEQQLQRQTSEIADVQAQYSSAVADRDTVNRRLQESEAALATVQKKYDALREERSAVLLRTASLEARVEDLSARLKESDATVQRPQQFLTHDRDIRELMGARELYIADVFDVDRNGETQKPFGRVFYTKGKTLVFYAFDLDQQAHLRNASIFQAWGRRGLNDKRPLNMGIFYLDNETNRRWVLRFDDPQILAQIDAVFVTVEPHGGSQKPSGKQLLFASLRSVANHP